MTTGTKVTFRSLNIPLLRSSQGTHCIDHYSTRNFNMGKQQNTTRDKFNNVLKAHPNYEKRRKSSKTSDRERERVRGLSRAFSRLKTTLAWVPADTKLSKLDTLKLTSCYIAYLVQLLKADEEISESKIDCELYPECSVSIEVIPFLIL